jgi:hypothetical protein
VGRVLRHGGFAEVARVLESLVTNCLTAALVRKQVRQHTSAIRQHTSAYVSIRLPHRCARQKAGTSAYVSIRQHTSAYVCIRQQTSADVSIRQHTYA